MKRTQLLFTVLQIPIDFAMIVAAFLAAYWLRLQELFGPKVTYVMPLSEYIQLVLLIAIFWIIIFIFTGMYNSRSSGSLWNIFYRTFIAVSVSLAIFIIILFGVKEAFFSRLIAAYAWFFAIGFIVLGRIGLLLIQRLLTRMGIIQERVVIIGNDAAAKSIEKFYNQRLAKVIFVDSPKLDQISLSKLIDKHRTNQVVVTTNLPTDVNLNLIYFCETNGIRFRYVPSLVGLYAINATTDTIYNYPLIELKPTPLDGWGRITKRLFDFILSALAIIILSPILIVVAIIVRLDSPGKALFIQGRPGQFGYKFNLYKFRSMYAHMSTGDKYGGDKAEALRKQLENTANEASGLLFKMKDDPRITKIGKFIRKTSLDELPQLFNVINGEMSLVGPRPPLSSEVAQYNKEQLRRLLVKPGITGLWQVSGRSETSFNEYLKLDMYYIEHWSLWIDVKIILKTIWVVLRKRGAY